MAEHAGSYLKPPRVCVADTGPRRQDPSHVAHHQGGSLRGTDERMPFASSDVESLWGVAAAGCLIIPPSRNLEVGPSAPGELKRLVPELAGAAATGPVGHGGNDVVLQQHRQQQDWERFSIPTWKPAVGKTDFDARMRHRFRFDNTPWSELKLDEELTMFESQITRMVSDHFPKLTSRTSPSSPSLSQERKQSAPVVNESNSGVAKAGSSRENLTKPSEPGEELKRQLSEVSETDGQAGRRGWIRPLRLLVRKGLTSSDVGYLGRIVIPKKDAESRSFPKLDTKEGALLEFEDYHVSKRWYFRFKYWINNKSRMYVLENTGEFIKYHSLHEGDVFSLFEDGCKKLVVCGRKKSKAGNRYPLLEASNLESSPSETPPTTSTKDDFSSDTTDVDNSVAARSGGIMHKNDRQWPSSLFPTEPDCCF